MFTLFCSHALMLTSGCGSKALIQGDQNTCYLHVFVGAFWNCSLSACKNPDSNTAKQTLFSFQEKIN